MNLQAMTLANLKGETRELTWTLPNRVPANTLPDATIEVLNSKSEHKVFAMFQGGHINPWGANEQSKYIADPFAGPWNHWPMHLVPSDGRFAVATDRVTHFALGANDAAPKFGSMVLYGFTRRPIASLVPLARSWSHPPEITALAGGKAMGYHKETRDYPLVAEKESMVLRIAAAKETPLVNPCFTVRNWGHHGAARVDTTASGAKDVRQGTITDTDGTITLIIWLELAATSSVTVTISGAIPAAGYTAAPSARCMPMALPANALTSYSSSTSRPIPAAAGLFSGRTSSLRLGNDQTYSTVRQAFIPNRAPSLMIHSSAIQSSGRSGHSGRRAGTPDAAFGSDQARNSPNKAATSSPRHRR